MRLEQMYLNILDIDIEDLVAKVEQDSLVRASTLEQCQKLTMLPKGKSNTVRLSDEEKAVLKALGLTQKDLKALMNGGGNE